MSAQAVTPYPVRVEASLDEPSRWLWLVKWVLIVPHAIVLTFLWIAFAATTIAAFFAILFTGRYPRSIFTFNVGVLRWSWRVGYYTYSALGTDRYPPFTLDETPDYPAHLEVAYPEHLSRGLVLIKWWLLAIPHYLIVAFLVGGTWFVTSSGLRIGSGIIGILVLIAAVALAFTGRYPQSLYDLVLGFNRWVLRVAAYAALMTDVYPPFRLDMGGAEGPSTLTVPSGPSVAGAQRTRGWSTGRIVSLVVGAVLAVVSLGPLAAGVAGLVIDGTQRDADGYINTSMASFDTSGYALTSEGVDVRFDAPSLRFARTFLGEGHVRVRSNGSKPVFAGVAREADVAAYMRGVERGLVTDIARRSEFTTVTGGPPTGAPTKQDFWTDSTSGRGLRTLSVPVRAGSWTLVVMNADASRGVNADVSFGATAPHLAKVAGAAIAVAIVLLGAGVALMLVPIVRSSTRVPA